MSQQIHYLMTVLVATGDIEVPVTGITPSPEGVSPERACAAFAQAIHDASFDEDEGAFCANGVKYTPGNVSQITEEQYLFLKDHIGLIFTDYTQLENCGTESEVDAYFSA